MAVSLTLLRFMPCATYDNNYSLLLTWICVNPFTKMPVLGSSRIYRLVPDYRVDVDPLYDGVLIGDSDEDCLFMLVDD